MLINRRVNFEIYIIHKSEHINNLQIEQPQLFSSLVNEWLDRTEEIL